MGKVCRQLHLQAIIRAVRREIRGPAPCNRCVPGRNGPPRRPMAASARSRLTGLSGRRVAQIGAGEVSASKSKVRLPSRIFVAVRQQPFTATLSPVRAARAAIDGRGEMQLRAALLGRPNPAHAPDFFDQSGEHIAIGRLRRFADLGERFLPPAQALCRTRGQIAGNAGSDTALPSAALRGAVPAGTALAVKIPLVGAEIAR